MTTRFIVATPVTGTAMPEEKTDGRGVTDAERGISGGRPSQSDRTGASVSIPPLLGIDPWTPLVRGRSAGNATSALAKETGPSSRGADVLAGFRVLAAWLAVGDDDDTARRLRALARTLAAPDQAGPFYGGLVTGLQLGVTQACYQALTEYRASLENIWDFLRRLFTGDDAAREQVARVAAQLMIIGSGSTPDELERLADAAARFAREVEKTDAELAAVCVDFAVMVSQVAKVERGLAALVTMSLGQLFELVGGAVQSGLSDEVRELVTQLLAVAERADHVGEELGAWLGMLIANLLLFVVDFILPISPGRAAPEEED